jgi:hypothetical protein
MDWLGGINLEPRTFIDNGRYARGAAFHVLFSSVGVEVSCNSVNVFFYSVRYCA